MRKWIISALTGLALAVTLAAVAWQKSEQDPGGGKAAKDMSLPIRQVMLFNSGVSYFEREGEVVGNVRIDLSFPTSDINDLLKSLVLQDMSGLFNSGVSYFEREGEVVGNVRIDLSFPTSDINDLLKSLVLQDMSGVGKISTVNYDSHDPIEKVLHSFSLNLNGNPSYGQILNQARGERIEIVRQGADNKPVKQTGVIVGVEVRKRPVGKDAIIDADFVNITGETGLQSIPLDQVQSVRFLNPVIDSEFQKALRVIASSHDTQKKSVSFGFTGPGKRRVKVSYVIEQPIWKSSYRLAINPDGKVDIQGWAIVENTTDDDWNDVRMVQVSGRPISFKMDLYEPLYIPRPIVEPELFASLRPQVYGGALHKDGQKIAGNRGPGMDKLDSDDKGDAKGKAGEGKDGGKRLDDELFNLFPAKPGIGREKTKDSKRSDEAISQQKAPPPDGPDLKQSISSMASAAELGEYYQYIIDQRITLPRQKSAMLPVLNQAIEGSKVSIYNPSVHPKYPLLGLRLKNSSKQPLNQGPITVYEENAYAGDTRILELQPNEERLLSYAVDQAVEIKTDVKSAPGPDLNLKLGERSLDAHYKMRETRTYLIKNRAQKPRTVLLEHPIRADWKLIDSQKPSETTRDLYRFQVKVPADATVSFEVVEDQARVDQLALYNQQAQLVASTGINVKTLSHVEEEKLLAVQIDKGFLSNWLKARVAKTYFVQNLSEMDRSVTVDHIVADRWHRLDERGDFHRGPEIFRFVLKVAQGKTADRKIIEESHYLARVGLLKELPEEKLHAYLASPVLGADVKAALTKVLSMRAMVSETRKSLDEVEGQLKELNTDQARLRENLKILQGSEAHKKFLDKFVAQETEIENLQRQIRQLQTTLQTRQRELDTFVAALTVE